MFDSFSKLIWAVLKPETWLILFLCIGILAVLKNRIKAFLIIQTILIISLVLLAKFPLGDVVLRSLEKAYIQPQPLKYIDGIIILGGAEHLALSRHWKQLVTSEGAERLLAGISLSRQFPEAEVVYIGKSAAALKQAIPNKEMSGIFFEEFIDFELMQSARSTTESAKPISLGQDRNGQKWVLVTSAYHMPRAVNVFCSAGLQVIPYPVDFRSGAFWARSRWNLSVHLSDLNAALKEWIGLVGYRLTGHTKTFWPVSDCIIKD